MLFQVEKEPQFVLRGLPPLSKMDQLYSLNDILHNGRRQFVGIKNILPESDQQCATTAMFFPINSAVRAPSLMVFLWMFLIDFLGMI